MAEMPSIMMLLLTAAAHADAAGRHCRWCSPGPRGQLHEAREVAVIDRQVLDLLGRDRERSLAALRLDQRDSAMTVTASSGRRSRGVIDGTDTRSPPLTGTPLRTAVLNPLIVTSTV
jgi:hypothetical protein